MIRFCCLRIKSKSQSSQWASKPDRVCNLKLVNGREKGGLIFSKVVKVQLIYHLSYTVFTPKLTLS